LLVEDNAVNQKCSAPDVVDSALGVNYCH